MSTREAICNATLAYLGKASDERVLDLSAPSNNAERIFAQLFPITLDQELRKHMWNCARTKAVLSQLATVLTDTAKPYQYQLPNDYIRAIRERNDDYERWRDKLVSAHKTNLTFTYVARIDGSEADPMLAEAIARAMQVKLARPATKSNVEWQAARTAYTAAIAEARKANALEEGPVEMKDGSDDEDGWLGARY